MANTPHKASSSAEAVLKVTGPKKKKKKKKKEGKNIRPHYHYLDLSEEPYHLLFQ